MTPGTNVEYSQAVVGSIFDYHGNANSLAASLLPSLQGPDSAAGQAGASDESSFQPPRSMNIVIQIVGSRGDVQPFVALGLVLQQSGHRVRLATHPTFKEFVEKEGLEFFSIGGDPAALIAFMVKNPGLLPGVESLRNGDVMKQRKTMSEILRGCWLSCIASSPGTKGQNKPQRFLADAIIANPPSFAHAHCAERLGIPLHLMFTMPWSPTRAFAHPLANLKSSDSGNETAKYLSYPLVDLMTWQGIGDLVNTFRTETLGLDEMGLGWAVGLLERLKIPMTYCWSPALIPKPLDWGSHISIAGFYFLENSSIYVPPPELEAFLAAGPSPLYIHRIRVDRG